MNVKRYLVPLGAYVNTKDEFRTPRGRMRAIMRTRSGWTPAAYKIYGPRLVAVTTTSDHDASNFYAQHYPSSFWEAYLAMDLRKHDQYRGLSVIRYPRE